eukprot:2072475-Prymnesium_polylepis.1
MLRTLLAAAVVSGPVTRTGVRCHQGGTSTLENVRLPLPFGPRQSGPGHVQTPRGEAARSSSTCPAVGNLVSTMP